MKIGEAMEIVSSPAIRGTTYEAVLHDACIVLQGLTRTADERFNPRHHVMTAKIDVARPPQEIVARVSVLVRRLS